MRPQGAQVSDRAAHVRDQIAQLLYTQPGERVFLRDFGLGLSQILFAPMTTALLQRIEVTLSSQLAEALRGEVLADSIRVRADAGETGRGGELRLTISYRLAALNREESLQVDISEGE
jgi:phage baseplate assembly protein W